ncbi:MAG: haloacid dehalogenase-like hydrolase [Chloroflexi bacterium]|nr:haloacid dehalogenase-like hydrolase [Chloroflexota bacterium]
MVIVDLERVLTAQPSLQRLCETLPHHPAFYSALERYDRLAARDGDGPGMAYAYLLPFLLAWDVDVEQIKKAGDTTPLMPGAAALLRGLAQRGWRVFCVTGAYDDYAHAVAQRLGIQRDTVLCTRLTITRFRHYLRFLGDPGLEDVPALAEEMASLRPGPDDTRLKARLDDYFREALPGTPLGGMVQAVRPLLGPRKVLAVEALARDAGYAIHDMVAVGSQASDAAVFSFLRDRGGAAIAFNALAGLRAVAGAAVDAPTAASLLKAMERPQRR